MPIKLKVDQLNRKTLLEEFNNLLKSSEYAYDLEHKLSYQRRRMNPSTKKRALVAKWNKINRQQVNSKVIDFMDWQSKLEQSTKSEKNTCRICNREIRYKANYSVKHGWTHFSCILPAFIKESHKKDQVSEEMLRRKKVVRSYREIMDRLSCWTPLQERIVDTLDENYNINEEREPDRKFLINRFLYEGLLYKRAYYCYLEFAYIIFLNRFRTFADSFGGERN